jgi:hypothetical protein
MWFHYTASGVYIEHGHQYDPYCSFEYLLAPLKRRGALNVALPLSHRAIPYFTNLLGDLSTHNIDARTASFYVRALWELGPKNFGALLSTYVRLMGAIVSEAGDKSRRARQALAELHALERDKVAATYGLAGDVVRALDQQHATPAEFSLFKMIQCFYADRFVLGLLTLGVVVAEDWLIKRPLPRLLTIAGTLSFAGVVAKVLAALRRVDVRAQLREGARAIGGILSPRVIIFGHSHRAEAVRFGDACWYMNIGSWISRAAVEREADWGMTFAWIDPPAGQASGLYRWQGSRKEVTLVQALKDDGRASAGSATIAQDLAPRARPLPCPE